MTKQTKNTDAKQAETQDTKTQNPENTVNDNKAVFGPLGKYAVVAVIMVSIIVTTAIMLDKQLNSVSEHIAEIESEVAALNDYTETTTESTEVIATATQPVETPAVETLATAAPVPVKVKAAEPVVADTQKPVAQTQEVAIKEVIATEQQAVEEVVAESPTAVQPAVVAQNAVQASQQLQIQRKLDRESQAQENKARIEASKLEQKQHMAELFARIKVLESKQLTRYKDTQDKQIVRLREQISQQNKMIETLISRNKDHFDLRAASMQRQQQHREEMLNRI